MATKYKRSYQAVQYLIERTDALESDVAVYQSNLDTVKEFVGKDLVSVSSEGTPSESVFVTTNDGTRRVVTEWYIVRDDSGGLDIYDIETFEKKFTLDE